MSVKRGVFTLILAIVLFLPLRGEDIEAFFHLGMEISFFHTQGSFSDKGLPEVEFNFVNGTASGAGITFAGIGLGLKWINFASPYTERATRRLFVIYLAGTDIGYYQNGEEKLFDISLSSKKARLITRGRFFLDLGLRTGFRYWRLTKDQPSLYQVYLGFSLMPGVIVFSPGCSRVFVE